MQEHASYFTKVAEAMLPIVEAVVWIGMIGLVTWLLSESENID